MSGLVFGWREIGERGVTALGVVERLEILEHRGT